MIFYNQQQHKTHQLKCSASLVKHIVLQLQELWCSYLVTSWSKSNCNSHSGFLLVLCVDSQSCWNSSYWYYTYVLPLTMQYYIHADLLQNSVINNKQILHNCQVPQHYDIDYSHICSNFAAGKCQIFYIWSIRYD